jgi:hypothetical protein
MNRKFFKEIDVRVPIWKTRSVGLAVDDVPIGENVKVTISYKKTGTGELLYPGDYIVSVDEIRKYPAEMVGPVTRVHIVPIAELAKLTVFSNQQKQANMLFDSKSLGKIIKESEDSKTSSFDSKKTIEPGKHIMHIIDVTLQNAKSDNNPMVVIEMGIDDEHRTIKEYFKIAGNNTDIPREKLVRLFHRGFGYSIQPCQTEKDLIDQLLKFKGKTFTGAIKGRKEAYCFEKNGASIVMETIKPEFWYAGTTSEFDEMYIDMSKSVTDLSQDDKEKLIRFAEINGGPYVPAVKTEAQHPVTKEEATAPAVGAPAPMQMEAPQQSNATMEMPPKKTMEVVEAKPEPENADKFLSEMDAAPIQHEVAVPVPQKEAEDDGDFPF